MKKNDLVEALEVVKPGLANKDLIEQTTSFAFINGNVVTYNDEISISSPIEDLEIETEDGDIYSTTLKYEAMECIKSMDRVKQKGTVDWREVFRNFFNISMEDISEMNRKAK